MQISLKKTLAGGWVPFLAVLLLTSVLWHMRDVECWEIAAFLGYVTAVLVIPGTLTWRWVRRGSSTSRLWLEDVVLGTILGYAIEIPMYIAARLVGLPLLVLLWPLAVVGLAVVTRSGRTLWRPRTVKKASAAWAWTMAVILVYLILFVAKANWWQSEITQPGLRVISADGAFQLAMVGELRHHVPPQVPWVAGEPMHYHWLFYVHAASTSWITQIEPIVLLRRLSPAPIMIVTVLAAATITARITKRAGAGLLAAGILVVVHSPAIDPSELDHFQRQEFTSQAIYGSPTLIYGTMFLAGSLFLMLEILDGNRRRREWVVLALLLAAAAGGKATFGPMLFTAMLGVVSAGVLLKSNRPRHYALLGLTGLVWMLFQFGFYAAEDSGTRLSIRGTADYAAAEMGAATLPSGLSAELFLVIVLVVLLWTVHAAGMLGLIVNGGWRDSRAQLLGGLVLAGTCATLLLDIPAFSQQWFVSSTQVPVAVGAAWGISRLVPRARTRQVAPTAVTALLLGAASMSVVWNIADPANGTEDQALDAILRYGDGFLIAMAVFVVLAFALSLLPQPGKRPMMIGTVFLAAALTGFGLFRTTQLTAVMTQVPWHAAPLPVASERPVGRSGVEVARWIREHSDPGDLVATNAHTTLPDSQDVLAFWFAAYSERRTLVESWGYTPRHNARVVEMDRAYNEVGFWDPAKLETNDQVFESPSIAAVTRLRVKYGVRWLILDRRFDGDESGLDVVAGSVFKEGDYAVYTVEPRAE